MLTDLTHAFSSAGPTGFVIILLAFVALTLLSSLIALVKWVLGNMVQLSVHEATQDDVCDLLGEIRSDTRLLVDRGSK